MIPSSKRVFTGRGAALVEAMIVTLILVLVIGFTVAIGMALDEESRLRDTTYNLARFLAADLGTAFKTGAVDAAGGSCNTYLRNRAAAYLASRQIDVSVTNPNATYYFGQTLDDGNALTFDVDAPYAILRMVGRTGRTRIFGDWIRSLQVESSLLVEYHLETCNDYSP